MWQTLSYHHRKPILRRNDFTFGCFSHLVVVSLVACCHQVAEHECDAKTILRSNVRCQRCQPSTRHHTKAPQQWNLTESSPWQRIFLMLYLRRHADRQAGPPAVVSMSFEKVPVGDVALSCVEEKEERERERESKGMGINY